MKFKSINLISSLFSANKELVKRKKKIMINFEVAHIHPNNCNGTFPVSGEKLPTALEITFLRKDLCRYKKNVESLPHKLDSKNIKKLPNVYLSKKWYK